MLPPRDFIQQARLVSQLLVTTDSLISTVEGLLLSKLGHANDRVNMSTFIIIQHLRWRGQTDAFQLR